MTPTRYTLTVDTEEEWDWDVGYPTVSGQVSNIARLPAFQAACDRHGAAVTYFVNHAVLADPDARAVILDLSRRPRVEIGLHIHPWNTPPLQKGDRVPVRDSFLHNLPPPLALAKLRTVYDTFAEHGLRPTAYRGGRYSTSPLIQDFLRDRGFVADCSFVPFTNWADDGAPDHRGRGLLPVRRPPRTAADRALWEIPLTLGFTRGPDRLWAGVLAAAARPPLRWLRAVGVLGRLGVVRKCWLNFENALGEGMLGFLTRLRSLRLPAVCFTLHSSSLLPGGSPYARGPADVERLYARLDAVLGEVGRWPDFAPATVTELADQLERDHHARDRH